MGETVKYHRRKTNLGGCWIDLKKDLCGRNPIFYKIPVKSKFFLQKIGKMTKNDKMTTNDKK